MKKLFYSVLAVCFSLGVSAQTTDKGGPVSWKGKIDSKLSIPLETMPGYDQELVDMEDSINDIVKVGPWRFGYEYETDFSLENSGSWVDLPNNNRVWRLKLKCEGALTVNVIFEDLYIPEGAHIYLYDIDRTNLIGAYTSRNNRQDGLLGSELVHGEEIVIEYYEPASVSGQGHFKIGTVVHGYRGVEEYAKDMYKALNSSGDCNVDVNCPLGIGWENQIRSVGMLVNGGGFCSGALINNTCDDGTPYFLTANHCGTASGSWNVRFNWESPPGDESCATTTPSVDPGPPYDQTSNGCTPVVQNSVSDYNLITIDNLTLSDAQNWNLFYAGWDNSDAQTVTQGTGIHHPSGDVKKICREDNSPYHATAGSPTAQVWMIDDWDQGVTEPGSSGSPLFDQNGRIIGQLYGGAAACSGTNDNNQLDYYGRFGVSWNNGASTYLAPGGCGTPTVNDGFDPNAATLPDDAGILAIVEPVGLYCTDTFDPIVTLRNYGTNDLTSVTINYDIDAGPNNTFTWTGTLLPNTTVDVTLPTITATNGPHVFNAYTTLPNGVTDSNPGNDDAMSNFTATVGGQPITLDLNTDCWGSEITWEIQDASSNVIISGGPYTDVTGGELISVNFCLAPGCYDFIINDSYGDGMYGTQWGCAVDGDYTITDDNSSTVLASIQAANSDYGNQEINNFCVVSPCSWTLSSTTVEENCFGDDNGSITVVVNGGSGPFTYDIGSGPQGSDTFTNLAQGSYSITVDDGSCSDVINVTLGGPSQINLNVSITDITCPGVTDGEINASATGGTGPYMYDIGGSGQPTGVFVGLVDGAYTVTVVDNNGCIVQSNEAVAVGSGFNVTGNTTDVSCNGDTDGQIVAVPGGGSAPYTYSIDGGTTTQGNDTFTGLAPGSYTVDVTDNNGCTGQTVVTVGEPAVIGGGTSVTDEYTGNDGAIDLTVTGGTGPYTYAWTGPGSFSAATEDITGLAGGLYSVTITDANGCTHQITDVLVTSYVGLDENGEIQFSLYPNPSNGVFNVILYGEANENTTVDIIDVTGRLVYQKDITGESSFVVDIADKANGTYILRITSGNRQSQMTIVNNK